jgi:hypothetical protein
MGKKISIINNGLLALSLVLIVFCYIRVETISKEINQMEKEKAVKLVKIDHEFDGVAPEFMEGIDESTPLSLMEIKQFKNSTVYLQNKDEKEVRSLIEKAKGDQVITVAEYYEIREAMTIDESKQVDKSSKIQDDKADLLDEIKTL